MNKPQLKTITPEIARAMLKGNTHNLPVRASHVDYLASEMTAGRWSLTHQGIAFDEGVVVDGQHRLLAVVQSGVTIQAWVFGDVPLSVQELIDKGRIRSIADELGHFGGVQYAAAKAATCRAVLLICCNFQNVKMSVGCCKTILAAIGGEIEVVIKATENFHPGRRAWVHGALALALSADRSVEPFILAFGSGENLKTGDPAKALRDWLTNGGLHTKKTYKGAAVEGVFNAAYNALQGQKLQNIKRGFQGIEFFLTKKRKLVGALREDAKQQMDIPSN